MDLANYMKANSLTDEEMAKRIGKERSVVTRYRRGEIMPPPDVIRQIRKVTDLAVCFDDWFPSIKRKRA